MARAGTETSDFGVSKREGHDSSKFYASRLYEGIKIDENQEIIDNSHKIDPALFDQLSSLDNANVSKIPDKSIHLVIFTVPSILRSRDIDIKLFIGKIIGQISQLKQKLMIGARLVVIVDDQVDRSISPSGFWPIHAHLATRIIELGLFMRGEVILKRETNGKIADQANISKIHPDTIHIKSMYSHGLIFGNGIPSRIKRNKKTGSEKTDTISRDQFLESTKSMWSVNSIVISLNSTDQKQETVNLDYYTRFLHMYSFQEDTIMVILNENDESVQKEILKLRQRTFFAIFDS